MHIGYKTHVGLVREHNEDSFLVLDEFHPRFCLLAVADGMGGHNAGEIASSMAIQGIKDYFMNSSNTDAFVIEDKYLNHLIEKINGTILEAAKKNSEYNGMGTTLTFMVHFKNQIHIFHIGDSRAYRLNDNGIERLTEDHSLVAGLLKEGKITEEEAKTHPRKNIITRALGTDRDIQADRYHYELDPKDIIILCTDGLTNSITEEEIYRIIKDNTDFQQAAKQLVKRANENGGRDNITTIIFQC